MTKTKQFYSRVHELTEFCREENGKCFAGWRDETLFFYIAFHALCGTLFVVKDAAAIKAVLIAQPMPVGQIGKPFRWMKTSGDAIMVWGLIGERVRMSSLYRRLKSSFPDARRFFGWREKNGRNILVEFSVSTIERFARV